MLTNKIIQPILEGMTGQEAADVIYSNFELLDNIKAPISVINDIHDLQQTILNFPNFFVAQLKKHIDNDTIYWDETNQVIKSRGGSGPTEIVSIQVSINPANVGQCTIEATGDVLKIVEATDKSNYLITAVKTGNCTVSVIPEGGYKVKQLNVDKVSQGAISEYTFENLDADHTMYVWMEESIEQTDTDFLVRSDKPGVYYSSIGSCLAAIQEEYPEKLTQDIQTISDTKSATIEYQSTPLTLEALVLNEGKISSTSLTIPVAFTYSGSYTPTKYRLGEVADLTDVVWVDYSDSINYTFTSIGSKTVYGQLQDAEGNLTEIKHSSITIVEPSEKTVVSIGWTFAGLGNVGSVYDETNQLVKVALQTQGITRDLYTTTGQQLGTVTKVDSEGTSYMMESQKGASTGDNSGIYPDEILEHNICTGSNSEKYREFKFEGFSAGTYKIRLFCSTIHANSSSERSRWKVNVDGVETEFSIPTGFNPNNNLTQWLEQTVEVGENGFSIFWGVNSSGSYIYVPLNIIDIEKI